MSETQFKEVCTTEQLMDDAATIARKHYVDLFHRFGWLDLGEQAYIEEQKELLEKRQ